MEVIRMMRSSLCPQTATSGRRGHSVAGRSTRWCSLTDHTQDGVSDLFGQNLRALKREVHVKWDLNFLQLGQCCGVQVINGNSLPFHDLESRCVVRHSIRAATHGTTTLN